MVILVEYIKKIVDKLEELKIRWKRTPTITIFHYDDEHLRQIGVNAFVLEFESPERMR